MSTTMTTGTVPKPFKTRIVNLLSFGKMLRHLLLVLVLGAIGVTAGCATAPTDSIAKLEYERINDPLEPTNRAIFSFNTFIQAIVVRPLATLYNALPEGMRVATENFFTNLAEPRNIANALLQGDPQAAGTSLGRFMTNSTVGLAGLVNVTGSENHDPRDFGQTLARWNGGTGAYLELPFIGASSTTAGIGFIVDSLYSIPQIRANSTDKDALPVVSGVMNGVRLYGENIDTIDNIYNTSTDPYVTFRNAYRQRRNAFVFGDDGFDFDDLKID